MVIAGLLIILLAFSVAISKGRGEVIVMGPEIKTGNPADYVKQPTTSPPTTPPAPGVTPPPVVTPVPTTPTPTPAPSPKPPAGLPATISFGGRTWQFSGGPVTVNVVTTGQLTDDHPIYRKQGDQPPFKVLYIESVPNSGKFYTYIPA